MKEKRELKKEEKHQDTLERPTLWSRLPESWFQHWWGDNEWPVAYPQAINLISPQPASDNLDSEANNYICLSYYFVWVFYMYRASCI